MKNVSVCVKGTDLFLFLLAWCAPLSSFSQLTVGLYEFEVTVDGEGAHGEGYVNVTVKPGEL